MSKVGASQVSEALLSDQKNRNSQSSDQCQLIFSPEESKQEESPVRLANEDPSLEFSHLELTQSTQIESDRALALRLAQGDTEAELMLAQKGANDGLVADHVSEDGFCEIFRRPGAGPAESLNTSDQYQYGLGSEYQGPDIIYEGDREVHPSDLHANATKKNSKPIEDEFDIIEDAGDQALIAYYNESPASPMRVPITDKVKQGITNLGFLFTTNGSKKVDLNDQSAGQAAAALQGNLAIYNSVGSFVGQYSSSAASTEAYIFADKYFPHNAVEFQERFSSLIWITYCKQFKPLLIELDQWLGKPVQSLKTDNLWGCTVRCCQMLIANALRATNLPIPERVVNYPNARSLTADQRRVIDILTLFDNDKRAGIAPYSIQNVAEIGLKDFGVYPGQWYGINTASLIFENLEQRYRPVQNFRICTFQDGNISLPRILQEGTCVKEAAVMPSATEFQDNGIAASQLTTSQISFDFNDARHQQPFNNGSQEGSISTSNSAQWQNQVLVVVSNRFGLKTVSQEYFKVIKKYMKLRSFIGLVGGKPRFAYYFVGHLERPAGLNQSQSQEDPIDQSTMEYDETDRLVFLDPHYVNPQLDLSKDPRSQDGLYHCKQGPRSIHMSSLDPCMSFGFLIKSREEFNQFSEEIARGIREDGDRRIFHLQENLECSIRSIISFQSFK